MSVATSDSRQEGEILKYNEKIDRQVERLERLNNEIAEHEIRMLEEQRRKGRAVTSDSDQIAKLDKRKVRISFTFSPCTFTSLEISYRHICRQSS